jgi:hypothetical protein
MTQPDDPDPFGDREVMQVGPHRRTPLVIAVCLIIALAGIGLWHSVRKGGFPLPGPTAASSPPAADPTDAPSQRSRLDFDIDLSWLHAATDYSLVVHAGGAVYRIAARTGHVERAWIPRLATDSAINDPGAVVPSGSSVLVLATGSRTVYVVPDDAGSASSFTTAGTDLLPGPDSRHVWVRQDATHLVLVGLDGSRTRTTLTLPKDIVGVPQSDRNGYVVVQTDHGVYDIRPHDRTRLASGRLVATGPTSLLITSCRKVDSCTAVIFGRNLKKERTAQLHNETPTSSGYGVISPDAHYAALADAADPSENPVTLIDLNTGTSRRLSTAVNWQVLAPGSGQLAFSPDGRWLFVIDPERSLTAVDTRCAASGTCLKSRTLPDFGILQQVAVRP